MFKNQVKKSFSYAIVPGLILQIGIPAIAMDERFQCKVPRNQEINQNIKDDANPRQQESSLCKAQRYGTAGIKDLCLAYGIYWVSLLNHEIAHAVTAHILANPHKTHIFMGPMNKKPLLSLGNLHVTSLLPTKATAELNCVTSPLRAIAIAAAGPIIGAATSYLCFKKLKKKYPKWSQYTMSKATGLCMTGMHLQNLYPQKMSSGPNDGLNIKIAYGAYKEHQARKKWLSEIADVIYKEHRATQQNNNKFP